jgi:hypothetical protein
MTLMRTGAGRGARLELEARGQLEGRALIVYQGGSRLGVVVVWAVSKALCSTAVV